MIHLLFVLFTEIHESAIPEPSVQALTPGMQVLLSPLGLYPEEQLTSVHADEVHLVHVPLEITCFEEHA